MSSISYIPNKKPGLKKLKEQDKLAFLRKEAIQQAAAKREAVRALHCAIVDACLKLGRSPLAGSVDLAKLPQELPSPPSRHSPAVITDKYVAAVMQLNGYITELVPHNSPDRLNYLMQIAGSSQENNTSHAKPHTADDLRFVPIKPVSVTPKHTRLQLAYFYQLQWGESYGWTEEGLDKFPLVKGVEAEHRRIDPKAQVFVRR